VKSNVALYALVGAFIGLHLFAPIMSNKILLVAGLTFTSGALLIGASYAVLDIINDWQGRGVARATVLSALIVRTLFFVVVVPVVIILPAARETEGFTDFMTSSVRLFLAGLASLFVSSYLISIPVFTWLKAKMEGRWFALRYLTTNFPVIVSATVVYVTLGFAFVEDVDLGRLYFGQTVARIIFGIAIVPIVWAVRASLRRFGEQR
jgi:uncharacterized integral membrane protein (TIGR00697 family)